jgi:hypothetical protein
MVNKTTNQIAVQISVDAGHVRITVSSGAMKNAPKAATNKDDPNRVAVGRSDHSESTGR